MAGDSVPAGASPPEAQADSDTVRAKPAIRQSAFQFILLLSYFLFVKFDFTS